MATGSRWIVDVDKRSKGVFPGLITELQSNPQGRNRLHPCAAAEERRGEEAAFELLELVTRDSALRAKLDAGDFERLLNDVKGIASEKVIEMLTRVRDAKASDVGNIDDSDEIADVLVREPGG
jgi:hypothetical protein